MIQTVPSICRSCLAFCPLMVTIDNGKVTKVAGDINSQDYEGYTCPKGRALPAQMYSSDRLLGSIKRDQNTVKPVSPNDAVHEIAIKIRKIIDEHGPRSVAMYFGNSTAPNPFGALLATQLLRGLGSPMLFTATTIDKPAEKTAMAMHGYWMGGAQAFSEADAWLLVGANPLIAKSNGLPFNNPGMRLKEAVRRGLKLIVIDPRKNETAKKAHLHLQALPGEDPTILAGLINVIIAEKLFDADFIAENVSGFEALRQAVEPFSPSYVCQRAGLKEEDLLDAARTFARAKRGMAICGTGPSFSTRSNLSFYLALCLNTICGRWARAAERAVYPNVLRPPYVPKAQAIGPYSPFGIEKMRVMDLQESAAGLPTAALPDEILTPGDGQVRALICVAGNPVSSFPNQRKTVEALQSLDLFVCIDVLETPTTQLAHYVIAPPMQLELPAMTYPVESLKYLGPARGFQTPWAQYVSAAVETPEGSDLMEEHVFFFRLAQALGVQLNWTSYHGMGKFMESPGRTIPLDMKGDPPSLDDLFELATLDSRIPLAEVKKYPHGKRFDINIEIEAKQPEWDDKLDVGNTMMMEELLDLISERGCKTSPDFHTRYPFYLISRRVNNSMNSVGTNLPDLLRGKPYNPAFVHPDDLLQIGVCEGELLQIESPYGMITAVAQCDNSHRRGIVSLAHGFGARCDTAVCNPYQSGVNVNVIIHMDEYDPMTGIPRMSGQRVSLSKAIPLAKETT